MHKTMSVKINTEIEECVRNNVTWQNLPIHLKQVMKSSAKDYDRLLFNYSIKNQLRYKGNLVRQVFRNEQRYYELLVDKSVTSLSLFPYHLADIITKGLRVTPFNYYIDVLSYLLKNDRSYDTLPNFTAADCLRVLGIGRNEYLALISELKTNSTKLFRKPNPLNVLPKFPVRIHIEPWWKVEIGYVLESDVKFINAKEISVIDDLIDFGSLTAGKLDYDVIQSLYRKGLIYLDVPISGEDKICIPPLRNFVMNRVSGDYFENLLYKIFVSTDEHMTISELAQMLQIDLDTVKHAVSLFCRLGFARKKTDIEVPNQHASWQDRESFDNDRIEVTPLNFHALLVNETNTGLVNSNGEAVAGSETIGTSHNSSPKCPSNSSNGNNQTLSASSPSPMKQTSQSERISNSNESDGNISDFSIISQMQDANKTSKKTNADSPNDSLELEDSSASANSVNIAKASIFASPTSPNPVRRGGNGKRVLFLFDATLTAFLMMGNLSPGLKNHAVTMFEVGKLCDESMDTFLSELEKVSLLDAEGEGEVSRYFAHAVILRSTIIALRNLLEAGIDLLRLECLESLDCKTRDRLLEKKYKFIISAAPLTSLISTMFTIPFFGQFFKGSDNSHIWSKLFYYHMSGYGPPSLLLTKGSVLKVLPKFFLGYGKLLVTIVHTDSYVINSENFRNLNDQLKNGCVLVQGYGIRNPATVHYEAFPFSYSDATKQKWINHKGVQKLEEVLNLKETCGYITFVNTGVMDIGCEQYDPNVHIIKPKRNSGLKEKRRSSQATTAPQSNMDYIPNPSIKNLPDLASPMDGSEITSFNIAKKMPNLSLRSPDENHFAITPQNQSPANVYRSADCNELLAKELEQLNEVDNNKDRSPDDDRYNLVSQSSIEIEICDSDKKDDLNMIQEENEVLGEEWTVLDVHFGVPLFDIDCNTRICEHLVKKLCNDEILEKLPQINGEMNKLFQKFVSQCLYFEDENVEQIKFGKLLPPPRINLAFENGKVCYWNGK